MPVERWNFGICASLTIAEGLVFYGNRLVIPAALRQEVLDALHTAHHGVTKTMQRAQESVYWPGIRRQIEDRCIRCALCVMVERLQRRELLIPMPVPSYPFRVVGIDQFEVEGSCFLMVVDYLTKWPIVRGLSSNTSEVIIRVLREVFSEMGTPEVIVSDNAPQLVSRQFRSFLNGSGIEYRTSSPIHPSGNGQVECHRHS